MTPTWKSQSNLFSFSMMALNTYVVTPRRLLFITRLALVGRAAVVEAPHVTITIFHKLVYKEEEEKVDQQRDRYPEVTERKPTEVDHFVAHIHVAISGKVSFFQPDIAAGIEGTATTKRKLLKDVFQDHLIGISRGRLLTYPRAT